ncbi:MAG: Nramp family divalent metal transporter, partial [Candidatus Komeilibacteria bacterium]|nr:Nramp family divalent metal transporter [Candidatus Komeilibacteria bacterium]
MEKKKAVKEFPAALPLRKLIGPSFIILAMGLGSGEVILWPYLTTNYGLGLAWAALLGITFQYFINMEIERYALVRGESVFVGLGKIFRWAPYWFIVSTFVGFGLPGIIAASAQVIATLLGLANFKWLALGMLVTIGLIISSGKTVYTLMEKLTRTIIIIGVPFIFVLAVILATQADWSALWQGLIGRGQGFVFIPEGISLAAFLAAFAYSGAGGNLNLTQSIYVKEKGYGMGLYAQKIKGLFTDVKVSQEIQLEGTDFALTPGNLKRFHQWWRRVSLEHALVFWLVGIVSMLMLMLLAHSTAFGTENIASGINFVLAEGDIIGGELGPLVGALFLLGVGIMLFQTQLGILDSTSRIMSENAALIKLSDQKNGKINLSRIYFLFLWAQILFGSVMFLLNIYEPKTL